METSFVFTVCEEHITNPLMTTHGICLGFYMILQAFVVCCMTACGKVEFRGHTKLDVQIEELTELTSSYLKAAPNHADSASIKRQFKQLGFGISDFSNQKVHLVLLQKTDNYFLWAQDKDFDYQSVIACSALPPRSASAKLLDPNVYVIARSGGGRTWFTSQFPPVPGCEFLFDLDFDRKHQIKYPPSAIERLKIYYPELVEKIRSQNYVVSVSPYTE